MMRWLEKLPATLEKYAEQTWFVLLVAFLAALDAYIVVVPNEALLVPAVLARKSRWIRTALVVTFGSALGAASFAFLTARYGAPFLDHVIPGLMRSSDWQRWLRLIHEHGVLGLGLVSLSPFPQHAAVALAGLARMNTVFVFGAVFIGRAIKYLFVAWATVYSPKLLRKLRFKKP